MPGWPAARTSAPLHLRGRALAAPRGRPKASILRAASAGADVAPGDPELVAPGFGGASDDSSLSDEPPGPELRSHDRLEVAAPSELVPVSWWAGGLALGVGLCVAVLAPLFAIPAWQVLTSALLACLIAVLAVRALGQTDLNPVSAVGKLSQILFTLLAPGHVVTNACRPRAPTPDWQTHRQWVRSSRPRAPQRDRSSPARWPRRARCRRAT